MATVIHHGGGVGTYKTFSVIQRHAIPQLQKGRTIVSTVRGFDSVRVVEAIMEIDIPESAQIIFVDLETTEGIEKIRRWWEWVPKGAYIIIDEAQLIYPKTKRITAYDYVARDGMSPEETAEADDRPNGFLQAFTMQRHYNWDLAIICPNIRMLVPEIREVTQIAYEHRYLGGLMPWLRHGWREVQHLPNEAAKTSAHAPKRYNADQRIYRVYKSTKTGKHSNSGAEQSIFKNPRVIGSLSLAVCGFGLLVWLLTTQIFGDGGTLAGRHRSVDAVQISDFAGTDNGSDSGDTSADSVQPVDVKKDIETTVFESRTMSIVGKLWNEYVIEIGKPPNAVQITTGQLYKDGIEIEILSDCQIKLKYDNENFIVRCPLHNRQFKPEKQDVVVNVKPFDAIVNHSGGDDKRAMASGAFGAAAEVPEVNSSDTQSY